MWGASFGVPVITPMAAERFDACKAFLIITKIGTVAQAGAPFTLRPFTHSPIPSLFRPILASVPASVSVRTSGLPGCFTLRTTDSNRFMLSQFCPIRALPASSDDGM